MTYGVVRSDNQNVLMCIKQSALTRKPKLEKSRGTLKVAHLKGDNKIRLLVAISLHDSKLF